MDTIPLREFEHTHKALVSTMADGITVEDVMKNNTALLLMRRGYESKAILEVIQDVEDEVFARTVKHDGYAKTLRRSLSGFAAFTGVSFPGVASAAPSSPIATDGVLIVIAAFLLPIATASVLLIAAKFRKWQTARNERAVEKATRPPAGPFSYCKLTWAWTAGGGYEDRYLTCLTCQKAWSRDKQPVVCGRV